MLKTEAVPLLTGPQAGAVRGLAAAAAAADGVGPLSEQTLLRLPPGDGTAVVHLLAEIDGELAGYGQLDRAGMLAEIVVNPRLRRRGAGRVLLDAALLESTGAAAEMLHERNAASGDGAAAQRGTNFWVV